MSLPGLVNALGLGKLQVNSALDEPLDAQIDLTSVTANEFSSLEIRMGSLVDFKLADIQRAPHLSLIKFETSEHRSNQVNIFLTTELPISEPFLHFLIVAEWAGGKLIREYTALLDPPLYAQGRAAAISMPKIVGSSDRDTSASAAPAVSSPAGETLGADSEGTSRVSADGGASTMTTTNGSGMMASGLDPTTKGDTLWAIAERISEGRDIYQVMIALARQNPDAFVDRNINRLKTGQTLLVPEDGEIESIGVTEARSEYSFQLQEWEAYKSQLAGTADNVQVADADSMVQEEEPEQEQKPEDAAERSMAVEEDTKVDSGESEDLLRIVQSTLDETPKQGSETVSVAAGSSAIASVNAAAEQEVLSLRNQISSMEETLLSRDLENRELREKVDALEDQVQNAARLIEIENENLALVQKQAQVKAAEVEKQKQKAKQAEQVRKKAEADAAAQPKKPKKAKATPPAAKKPVKKVAQKPAPEKDLAWWEEILDSVMAIRIDTGFNSMYMIGGGVLVILLLVGLMVYMRRRKSIAEFEDSILSGSALDVHSETTGTGSGTDTSFLSDFGVPGMGTMQADEVDPIAEAEVYLAYGRDEQAEEVLKEAISRDGSRAELKLKLLEIYQQRSDVTSFETLAEELYPAQGAAGDESWQRVAEMGSKLNPNNPLFKKAAAATLAASAGSKADSSSGTTSDLTAASAVKVDPRMEPFPEPEHNTLPDLDLGEHEDVVRADEPNLDFDLEDLVSGEENQNQPGSAATQVMAPPGNSGALRKEAITGQGETVDGGNDLDFDLGSDLGLEADDGLLPVDEGSDAGGQDLDLTLEDLDIGDTMTSAKKRGGKRTEDAFEISLEGEDLDLSDLDDTSDSRPEPQSPVTTAAMELPEITSPDLGIAEETVSNIVLENGSKGAVNESDSERWDEAATKLDLAKAYIDMGDQSGARSIIDEVMKEGNEGQKKQAAELAAQISG